MRGLEHGVINVVHASFHAESLDLPDHSRRLRDVPRGSAQRFTHGFLTSGEILHVDHLTDAEDGNTSHEHEAVFPARSHRDRETEAEGAE